jgi:alkylation response protein AidB-like acyl-CoA dehydrogenase
MLRRVEIYEQFRLRQQSSAVLPDYFAVSYDDFMSRSGRLGNLIEEHLRPDVVRIDTEGFYPEAFLRRFGAAGGFALHAASPDKMPEAIDAMAQVGRFCGSTAFLIWCHDACVWYLANTANQKLRERLLQPVASGARLGATALSNPMKHFSDLEVLRLTGERLDDGYQVRGSLPWVSNLTDDTVFACIFEVGNEAVMALVECGTSGLQLKRTAKFAALEGTATYSLRFDDVRLQENAILAYPARLFARLIRAGFILLQLGIGFGITQGAIDDMRAADRSLSDSNRYLPDRPDTLEKELRHLRADAAALASTPLDPSARYSAAVMELRLQTAELALRAAQSALLHSGAKGFMATGAPQRRMREATFFAILTPSIKHLRKELAKYAAS